MTDSLYSAIGVANMAMKTISKLPGFPKGRDGGYFTLRSKDGQVRFIAEIGECPSDKAEKYRGDSEEKGLRLIKEINHISSWQSKNEENEQYGGAIVTDNYVLSFSGSSEEVDEAVMLATAFFFGWLNLKQITKITNISKNRLFDQYYMRLPKK